MPGVEAHGVAVWGLEFFRLGFVSDFGFRNSDFEFTTPSPAIMPM
jgi:hypothetical protein